jgi:hypothetical protein
MHYYKVVPHDHPEIKPFYIGLDELNKQVFFYDNNIEDSPEVVIHNDGTLQYHSEQAKKRVPLWLIFLCLHKAQNAFLAEKLPSNISFQS